MNRLIGVLFLLISCTACTSSKHQIIYDQDGERVVFDAEYGVYDIWYKDHEGNEQVAMLLPGNIIEPTVTVSVEKDVSTESYHYHYEVHNGPGAKMGIAQFFVEVPASYLNQWAPNAEWHTDYYPHWRAVEWTHFNDEKLGIFPDSSLAGFSFSSTGPPGIVNGYAENFSSMSFPDHGPNSAILPFILELDEANKYIRFDTVGPVPLPSPFDPLQFLDTLLTFVDASEANRWILQAEVGNEMKRLLQESKEHLRVGERRAAEEVLNNFKRLLEGPNGTFLTSEAYALFKINVSFLLGNAF